MSLLTILPILALEVIASYLDFSPLVMVIMVIIIIIVTMVIVILPLKVIVSYHDFSSLVSLSASTSSLAHLQPKQQIVKGKSLLVAGFNPTYSQKRISQKGISRQRSHHPEHYFDVEVETRGLLSIKMVWEWEGMVSIGNEKR